MDEIGFICESCLEMLEVPGAVYVELIRVSMGEKIRIISMVGRFCRSCATGGVMIEFLKADLGRIKNG